MQKAKEYAQEIMSNQESEEINFDKLKVEINSLLHCYLPPDTRLRDAETLSIVIYAIITRPEDFLKPTKP